MDDALTEISCGGSIERRVRACRRYSSISIILEYVMLFLLISLLISNTLLSLAFSLQTDGELKIWGEASVPALAVIEFANGTTLGTLGRIDVRILYPGEGRVYVNTEPLSDIDMQASVRAAVLVASYYAKANPLDFDILVSITADSPLIGGPSAGSAITAAVYSALTGLRLNSSVAATGMILPDGLIGPVGGVPYKVEAAIRNGYTTVLIPTGQSIFTETVYQTTTVGRTVVTRPVKVTWNVTDLAIKLGGRAIETSTAIDVIYRFTGITPLTYRFEEPALNEKELELTRNEFWNYINASAEIRNDVLQKAEMLPSSAIKDSILDLIQSSSNYSSRAIDMWHAGHYYTGISFAFVSLYQAMSAKYYMDSEQSTNPQSLLMDIHRDLSSSLELRRAEYESLVKDKTDYALDELFILSEVYFRILDANSTLDFALRHIASSDFLSASYDLGYAYGRIRSLDYWLALLDLTREGEKASVKSEKLVSWLLSYGYSSVNYLNAIQQVYGGIHFDTTEWYEKLSQASSLMSIGDYPGALSLATDVLVSASTTMQLLFSLNLTMTASILKEHSRLILGNADVSPVSARFYIMAGDAYYSLNDYESSLRFYERGLIILYASSMTTVKEAEKTMATESLPYPPSTEVQTEESPTETTSVSTYTPISYAPLRVYAILALIVIILLSFFMKMVRKPE